jgi:hypothetical protein
LVDTGRFFRLGLLYQEKYGNPASRQST